MSEFEDEMDEKKLPSGINVLTILTFVGSGIAILSGIWSYFKSGENLSKMEEMANSPEFAKMPDFAKKMFSPEAIALLRKIDENKLSLILLTVIAAGLCIYGAIEIRKLKKSGFYTYAIGELLPFVGYLIFVGPDFFATGYSAFISIGVAVLFIILYATQLKYLTKK